MLLCSVLLFLTAPAFGQADFAGNWAPLYHEDFPERIPGPELGDYMRIPINDAARLREYLATPFVTTTDFKKEPDGSKWTPSPCSVR